MSDYVAAPDVIAAVRQAATQKAALSAAQMLIRGLLAGAFLAYATSLALVILTQGLPPIAAAVCFPVGFVMLVLLGLELVTGNFAVLTFGFASGDVSAAALVRNWSWVYAGNLLGSVAYAVLFYLALSGFGTSNGGIVADQLRRAVQAKTLAYAALGAHGWLTAATRGVLCNWMVALGAVLAFTSRSTIGKIAAMWLPIVTFFALGYEHSVVNMFVIPAGLLFGAPVSIGTWWFWNQIPVTIGNVVGGALLTGVALHTSYPARARTESPASVRPSPGFSDTAAFPASADVRTI